MKRIKNRTFQLTRRVERLRYLTVAKKKNFLPYKAHTAAVKISSTVDSSVRARSEPSWEFLKKFLVADDHWEISKIKLFSRSINFLKNSR